MIASNKEEALQNYLKRIIWCTFFRLNLQRVWYKIRFIKLIKSSEIIRFLGLPINIRLCTLRDSYSYHWRVYVPVGLYELSQHRVLKIVEIRNFLLVGTIRVFGARRVVGLLSLSLVTIILCWFSLVIVIKKFFVFFRTSLTSANSATDRS